MMKRSIPILRRYLSSFDIFDRIKDCNAGERNGIHLNENDENKRKPSKKVLKLVDEILNLTLVEAADLCDLCQEKLEGSKNFQNSFFLNRTPFPHPSSFFAQTLPPGMVNVNAQASMDMNQAKGMNQIHNQNDKISKEENKQTKNTGGEMEEKKVIKNTFNVKMEKFDLKNKINTIKEIRKITNVGLKEAKEMVESAPFYIIKGLPEDKANEIKKTFEDLGATIIIE